MQRYEWDAESANVTHGPLSYADPRCSGGHWHVAAGRALAEIHQIVEYCDKDQGRLERLIVLAARLELIALQARHGGPAVRHVADHVLRVAVAIRNVVTLLLDTDLPVNHLNKFYADIRKHVEDVEVSFQAMTEAGL
jgi:hypothetical protein